MPLQVPLDPRLPPGPFCSLERQGPQAHKMASPSPTSPPPLSKSALRPADAPPPHPQTRCFSRKPGNHPFGPSLLLLSPPPCPVPCPAWLCRPGPRPVLCEAPHFHCTESCCTPRMMAAMHIPGLGCPPKRFTCINTPNTMTGVCLLPGSLGDSPVGDQLYLTHLHATQVASWGRSWGLSLSLPHSAPRIWKSAG